MSQINEGTVSVTFGSNQVVGDEDADLGAVVSGDLFTAVGTGVWYTVASRVQSAGIWTITLQTNYAGPTQTGIQYLVQQSFTPAFRLPFPEQGDVEAAGIVKRALLELDTLLSNGMISPQGSTDSLREVETLSRINDYAVRQVVSPGQIWDYQLQPYDGSSVDDGESIIIPADFNSSTNARVWVKIR